jgi:hypothetical protein
MWMDARQYEKGATVTGMDTEGQWVQRGMVLRFIPAPPPEPRRVADLIACPLCRATLSEPCRTAAGNWTTHDVRLVSRRCPCGNRPREGSHFCTDECRREARAATYSRREQRRPTKTRRAA